MTLAELQRALESKKRMLVVSQKERATFDYTLADLIGRSVARIYNSANKMPDIGTVYPSLFDMEEIENLKAQKQAELSALRFRQFADSFNKRFTKGDSKVTNE